METPIKTGRDPVCESIESLLRDMEADRRGTLETTKSDGLVHLSYGELSVEAVNYDIALVRLAVKMMDDFKYMQVLMDALRGEMQATHV